MCLSETCPLTDSKYYSMTTRKQSFSLVHSYVVKPGVMGMVYWPMRGELHWPQPITAQLRPHPCSLGFAHAFCHRIKTLHNVKSGSLCLENPLCSLIHIGFVQAQTPLVIVAYFIKSLAARRLPYSMQWSYLEMDFPTAGSKNCCSKVFITK